MSDASAVCSDQIGSTSAEETEVPIRLHREGGEREEDDSRDARCRHNQQLGRTTHTGSWVYSDTKTAPRKEDMITVPIRARKLSIPAMITALPPFSL